MGQAGGMDGSHRHAETGPHSGPHAGPDTRPPLRSFRRRGRMSTAKAAALVALTDHYRPVPHAGPVDLAATFGRTAPVVLDVGFGLGASVLHHARAHPGHDVLGIDVHDPGISVLLQQVHAEGLTNVRVERGDVVELLPRLASASLREIHVFFPDPWPKLRHRARRLLQPDVVAALVDRLEPGTGVLHVATDWADYAAHVVAVLAGEPRLRPAEHDRADRPVTKYEQRGLAAGRTIVDLRAARSA